MKHRIITAALASMVGTGTFAAELAIDVHGVRSGDGRIYLAVHGPATRDTFPSGEAVVEGLRAPARTGTMRFVVRDLAPGRYALSAFHDENDNGELDTNLMGIPSVGYGFGNDASAAFGPPTFEAAAVDVDAASGVTALTLAY